MEVIVLSRKQKSPQSSVDRFIDKILRMSMRGDFSSITDSLKGYWKDKDANPWDRFYKVLETYIEGLDSKDLSQRILLVREAVFCGLGMTSLSLPLDLGADKLLSILTKEASWEDGRREARAYCASILQEKIEAGHVDYIVETGLEKDGFGYLVSKVREARIEKFRKAKPDPDSERIDLTALRQSQYGRNLLRSLSILESNLEASDERVERLLEKYDHQLLELELAGTLDDLPVDSTHQVTLTGAPVQNQVDASREKIQISESSSPDEDLSKQEELTEYVTENLREVEFAGDLQALNGIGPAMESRLKESGYDSFVAIAHARVDQLSKDVKGVGKARAETLISGARNLLEGEIVDGEN
ncbi:MAG: helix-hairpin-helix domain-containing protein [Promethearchaeati archaeon]